MIVIGLQGKKRSGKDTFANFLVKHLEDKKVARTAFANPLKGMLSDISGVDFFSEENKETDMVFMLNMIKFQGHTDLLLDVSVFYQLDEFARLEGFGTLYIYTSKRKLMQFFGTDICRKYKGDLYWVNKLEAPSDADVLIVTDVRFQTEVDKIKSLGGIIVEIKNPLIESSDSHSSENAVLPSDWEVYNSGTLNDLEYAAYRFIHYTIKAK